MERISLALAIFVAFGASAGASTIIDIGACGAVVPPGARAMLSVDLTCSSGAAVTLQRGAKLDLAGHTITLGLDGANLVYGVYCERNCTVVSNSAVPGTIVGPGAAPTAPIGIYVNGNARFENLLFQDLRTGTMGTGRLRAKYVTAVGNTWGIGDWHKMKLESVAAYGNTSDGIAVSGVLRARNVSVHDNARLGIQCPDRLYGKYVSAISNGISGICAKRVVLRDSDLSANGTSDLYCERKPRLLSTTCETSLISGTTTVSWGVCSLD